MRKIPFLYTALGLIILLGVVHLIAESFHLYWTISWLDNLSHFLAGFALGFFSLYIFYESGFFGNRLSFSKAIFISFIFVIILGGTWEIFEYVNGLTQSTEGYSLDVRHDVLSDALGAISALVIARRTPKSSLGFPDD